MKKITSILIAFIMIIELLPDNLTAKANEASTKLNITINGLSHPIVGEAPDFDFDIVSSDFEYIGAIWEEQNSVYAAIDNESFVQLMPSDGAAFWNLEKFTDGERYRFTIALGANKLSVPVESNVIIKGYDSAGKESLVWSSGEIIPTADIRAMAELQGVKVPDFIYQYKYLIMEGADLIYASPEDHIHDAAAMEADSTGHWQSCSICGKQLGEQEKHADANWKGRYISWEHQPATATAEGKYYTVCEKCGYETRSFTIPKTGEQTIVTSYEELASAVAKGGKQYIKCEFDKGNGQFNKASKSLYVKTVDLSGIKLDDENADIFLDMNGWQIAMQSLNDSNLFEIKNGKLTVFCKESREEYSTSQYSGDVQQSFSFMSGHPSAVFYVKEGGELYVTNINCGVIKSGTYFNGQSIKSYGKLTIDGGYFKSNIFEISLLNYRTAPVLILGGEATINYGLFDADGVALACGGDAKENPIVTINNGEFCGHVGLDIETNGSAIINGGNFKSVRDDKEVRYAVIKEKSANSLIINDGLFDSHRSALVIKSDNMPTIINGGSFKTEYNEKDPYVTYIEGTINISGDGNMSKNVMLNGCYVYGEPCLHYVGYAADYIGPTSIVLVDGLIHNHLEDEKGYVGLEEVVIHESSISGNVVYSSAVNYNTLISANLVGDVAKHPSSLLHYQWQVYEEVTTAGKVSYQWNDVKGATTRSYTFTDSSYIGKKVRLTVTADGLYGKIVSPERVLGKEDNSYHDFPNIKLSVLPDYSKINIDNYNPDLEYIVLRSEVKVANLTEADWENALNGLSSKNTSFAWDGTNAYVYARFKATETKSVGKIVKFASIANSSKVYCDSIYIDGYGSNGLNTIWVAKGDTLNFPISYYPSNSNAGNDFKISVSGTTGGCKVTTTGGLSMTTSNKVGTAGNLNITGVIAGSEYTIKAYYNNPAETTYGIWKVRVYDPDNMDIYSVYADNDYPDLILAEGEEYTLDDLELQPYFDDTCDINPTVYMAKSNMGSVSFFTENDYLKINEATGTIVAKKSTEGVESPTVYVGVKDSNGHYKGLKNFKVTVVADASPLIESLTVSDRTMLLDVGAYVKINYYATPANTPTDPVSFISSSPSVVKVSSDGMMMAVAPGSALITVRSKTQSTTIRVIVEEKKAYTLGGSITGASSTDTPLRLVLFNEEMTSILSNTEAFDNNTGYVFNGTVSGNYKVVAMDDNKAVCFDAVIVDSNVTLNLNLKKGQALQPMVLSKASLEMPTNSTYKLVANLFTSETNPSITWSSSDKKVATVDSDGTITALRYGTATITATTANGTKASCKLQTRFYDVAGSNKSTDKENYQYYYNPVYWAAEKGITTGYDKVYFGVGKDCERRELMIFLWRIKGSPTPKQDARNYFSDLEEYKATSATNKSIAWAYENGITKGYEENGTRLFKPTDSISRKDTMIMLYRIAGKPAVSGEITFPDVIAENYSKKSDTYKAILWGSTLGITSGYEDGTFKPHANCLREQIVTFLYRANKKNVFTK